MLLKIYGVISILNIILGEKLRHDLKKNTEFTNKLKLFVLGKTICDRYIKRSKLLINSLLPVYNIFTCFENSMFFIFNIFNSKDGNIALLKAIDDSENN